MRGDKKDTAYQGGIVSFEDIINSSVKLNDHQLLQVDTAVNNRVIDFVGAYSITCIFSFQK